MSDQQNQQRMAERYRIAPDAFAVPGDRYLGSADVVSALVGGFCSQVEAIGTAMAAGDLSTDAAKSQIAEKIRANAAIFTGKDPAYQIVKGYHDVSLAGKLAADLGAFYRANRAGWGNDAVAVLFDWLASLLLEKMQRAQGDDMLLGVMLKPSVQYAVGALLGVNPRAPAVS